MSLIPLIDQGRQTLLIISSGVRPSRAVQRDVPHWKTLLLFWLLLSVIEDTLHLILCLIVETFHSNRWDGNWPVQLQFSKTNRRNLRRKKVTAIDADRRRMTVCWVLFPFQKEVWCCERLSGWALRWLRAPPGAVVSQVPCRNAFAATQTCSGESMTDLSSVQRVRMCVTVSRGAWECTHVSHKNFRAPCGCQMPWSSRRVEKICVCGKTVLMWHYFHSPRGWIMYLSAHYLCIDYNWVL